NLTTHWTLELCRYLAREEADALWDARPPLRTGAQRRAFLQDPAHKHVVYFTPKHGSWLNQIEIWFGVLTRRVLRRGEFRSAEELAQRIVEYMAHYNRHQAHPYAWTYTGKPLASGDKAKPKRRRFQRTRLMDIMSVNVGATFPLYHGRSRRTCGPYRPASAYHSTVTLNTNHAMGCARSTLAALQTRGSCRPRNCLLSKKATSTPQRRQ